MIRLKSTAADEKCVGSHGERIGDGSRCEPWVSCRFHKPTLPAKSAVGVATKFRIFMKVTYCLFKLTTADENSIQPTEWAKECSPGPSRGLVPATPWVNEAKRGFSCWRGRPAHANTR